MKPSLDRPPAQAGSSAFEILPGRAAKSSAVKSSREGIAVLGHVLGGTCARRGPGPPASGGGRRSRCRSDPRARGSTGRCPGGAGSAGPAPLGLGVAPGQSSGRRRWWRIGGPAAAAARASRSCPRSAGPQNPAQETTISASMMPHPSPIRTPVTLPPACSIPVTVGAPQEPHPGRGGLRSMSSCTARAADASPSEGTRKPPRTASSIQQRVEPLRTRRRRPAAIRVPRRWRTRACASGPPAVRGWWRLPARRPG